MLCAVCRQPLVHGAIERADDGWWFHVPPADHTPEPEDE